MDIQEKIDNLIRLAKRPGTPQEGEVARQAAIRLSLKYNIPCEYTGGRPTPDSASSPFDFGFGFRSPSGTGKSRYTPPKPKPAPKPLTDDEIFFEWIKALNEYGWVVVNAIDTKIGRQLRFRKEGFNSELRITQRSKGNGHDFEAEHIKQPDPIDGLDRSTTIYMSVHLKEVLRHIAYTKR